MASDLDITATAHPPGEELPAKKAPSEILKSELHEGIDTLEYPIFRLFISGLSAGLDVGFSLFLMAVMWTVDPESFQRAGEADAAGQHVLGGIHLRGAWPLRAIHRADDAGGDAGAHGAGVVEVALQAVVGGVGASNLAGRGGVRRDHAAGRPGRWASSTPLALAEIAHRMTDHDSDVIFLSAILAGWMMGLLSWLVAAGRDTISHLALVWLITWSIGFAGLHHVIAGDRSR